MSKQTDEKLDKLIDQMAAHNKTDRVSMYINNPLVWLLAVGSLMLFIYNTDKVRQEEEINSISSNISRMQEQHLESQNLLRDMQNTQKILVENISKLGAEVAVIQANRYTVEDGSMETKQRIEDINQLRDWIRSLENEIETNQKRIFDD